MLEKTIKRIVKRLWPELSSGLHLPHWGKIVKIPAGFASGNATEFTPLYAVDVQLLDDQGNANTSIPILRQVPLPASFASNNRGLFGFPQVGTLVEIGFIRGLQNRPFIRAVIVEGLTLPDVGSTDIVIKQRADVFQRANESGDWERLTPADIVEKCANYTETINDIKKSIAGGNYHIEGGKVWVGNGNHNALKLLSDLMSIVQSMAQTLASHTHKNVKSGADISGPPNQAGNFSSSGSDTGTLKKNLDSFVE